MKRQSRILVVDDDQFTLRSVAKVLEAEDYHVVAVASGLEALDLLKQDSFDLILTDLKMPEVDGFDVLRQAKEVAPEAVVLIFTGYASLESAIEALREGACDYLVKPCSDDELKLKILRGLERFRLTEERRRAEEALLTAYDGLEMRVRERTAELEKASGVLRGEIAERKRAEEALRQSERELAIRNRISEIFLTAPDAEMYGKVLQVILEAMESEYGVFGYIAEDGSLVAPSMTRDIWDQCQIPSKDIVFPPETWGGIWGRAMLEKKTFYSNETFLVPNGHVSIKRAVAVPIVHQGELVGEITVANKATDYDGKDAQLLESIADYIAPVLAARLQRGREERERKRAEEALEQRNQELAALNRELSLLLEASKAVSSSLELDEVLQIMAQKLTELARVVCCRVALLDETRENLIIHGAYPTGEVLDWEPQTGQRYPVVDAPWRRKVIETGEPVVWQRDEISTSSEAELSMSLGAEVKAVALLPVFLRGQVTGVVTLGERRGWGRSPLDAEKIGLCQAIINEMVMAIENARLYEETAQRARQIARAERHLAGVVESANDLIVSMDSEGRITTWNRTAKRLSGFAAEEVIGKRLACLCDKEHQAGMEAMVEQVARGEQVTDREMNLLARAGQRIPIAWSCSLMQDQEGRVMGIVAVGRDLTERRRLEAQLIQSAKMVSLGVMAGGIAHEIRNPLAVSSAAAQLLLEDSGDEQLRRECAEKMYSGVQRASNIVEDLLAFAHPTEGHKAPTDINQALEETLHLVGHQTTRHGIALEMNLSPQLPPVMGNKNLLQQVFSNMILNACNAMPDGGRLAIDTCLNADGQVEIRFADTGCGIPEEHLGRIFDPFFTTMTPGKGTGLGLSISYNIVQEHQGEIDVRSEVGVGSTFVIRLPVTEAKK